MCKGPEVRAQVPLCWRLNSTSGQTYLGAKESKWSVPGSHTLARKSPSLMARERGFKIL